MAEVKPPTRRAVTLRPRSVKAYTTSEGAIVEPHQQRYRVADQEKAQRSKTNTEPVVENVLKIHPRSRPTMIPRSEDGKFKHTSKVYMIPDNNGRVGYFKPESGEAWGVEKEGEFRPYRRSIQDDRLGRKEVLASQVARVLQVDSVPQTAWSSVSYKGNEFGEGSLQIDAKDLLAKKGYSKNTVNFSDWQGAQWNQYHTAATKTQSPEEFRHSIKEATLKNGGMDLAFFDYIIGNTDRHRYNYFVGTNPETGAHKIVGIDHGLSFPNSTSFGFRDYKTSLAGLWSHATVHGKNIDCSDNFKNSIRSKETELRLQGLLKNSKLTELEANGVMNRFLQVRVHLSESRKLTGDNLMHLLKSNIKGHATSVKA